MQFHRLAAIVICCATLGRAGILTATESPSASRQAAQPQPAKHSDGWRAVRREPNANLSTAAGDPDRTPRDLATSSDATNDPPRILAQSPDEDVETMVPAGPSWSYPSRRATTSVPVPDYRGQLDASRLRRSDSLALNSVGRSSASGRYRTSPAPASYQSQYQAPQYDSSMDSPPALPSF